MRYCVTCGGVYRWVIGVDIRYYLVLRLVFVVGTGGRGHWLQTKAESGRKILLDGVDVPCSVYTEGVCGGT